MKTLLELIKAKWASLKGKTIAGKIWTIIGFVLLYTYTAQISIMAFGLFRGIFTQRDLSAALIFLFGLFLLVAEIYRHKNEK